jgi:hypothetical protein
VLHQAGQGGQSGRINSSNNAAQAAILRAIRGSQSTRSATGSVSNAVGLVVYRDYPTYYIQNDPDAGQAGGFYLGDASPVINKEEPAARRRA